MEKDVTNNFFKNSKGTYIKNYKSERFYNFSLSSNIIGYSEKEITKSLKNNISNLINVNKKTVYHNRFLKLFNKDLLESHNIFFFDSIEHLYYFFAYKFDGLTSSSTRESYYFNTLGIKKSDKIVIHDTTELLLLNKKITKDNNCLNIINNYYNPILDLTSIDKNEEIIILPSLLNGYLPGVYVLISKNINFSINSIKQFDDISGYLLSHSIDFYNRINRVEKKYITELNNDIFIKYSRVFSPKNLEPNYLNELQNKMLEKQVIINVTPPFYSYFPLILDDNQVFKIKELLNDLS